jgi:hypothetical protein
LKNAGFATDYYRTGIVKSNTLNVKQGPDSKYTKAKEDLTKDTLVYIYDERFDSAGNSWVSL